MYSVTRCYFVGLLVVTFQSLAHCQYQGDLCFHKKKGVNGVCKVLTDCPAAIADLRVGIYPQHCGFEGTVVIACCPQDGTPPSPPSPPPPPSPPTTTTTEGSTQILEPTGNLRVGEKCKQACKNYEKLGYKKEYLPVLSQGVDYDLVENCPWEVDAIRVIYEGTKADFGEFPHMGLIGYGVVPNHAWKCGGTLISDKFVLTAAHCLSAIGYGNASIVRLGDLNYTSSNDDYYAQQINVKELHRHPNYMYPHHYNDIALLELEKPAKLSVYVKPACLHTSNTNEPRGLVTGWGNTEFGSVSEHLLEAAVEYFTPQECNRTFSSDMRKLPRGIDENLQICYGSRSNNKDSCPGDSGGPLQIYAKGVYCSYYIIGVTSFGLSCGHQNIPAGYVKVNSYIKWIEDIVWP